MSNSYPSEKGLERLTADRVTGKLDVREAAAKLPEPPTEPAAEAALEELLEEPEPEVAE